MAARQLDRAQAFADEHGIAKAYGSCKCSRSLCVFFRSLRSGCTDEELIADPDIDAIYNPLPNSLHMPWSVAAVRAGKHVLCEKPMCQNAEEAMIMQRESEDAGRVLIEAFHTIYHPATIRARDIVRSGVIGAVYSQRRVDELRAQQDALAAERTATR